MAEGTKTRAEILAELWSVTPEEAAQHEAARLAKRAAKTAAPVESAAVEPTAEPEAKKKDDAAIDPA